jgi:hypothetical protein
LQQHCLATTTLLLAIATSQRTQHLPRQLIEQTHDLPPMNTVKVRCPTGMSLRRQTFFTLPADTPLWRSFAESDHIPLPG